MARHIQDFRLVNGDQVGEILADLPIPDGATMETLVHERMEGHFDAKSGVQGVRVISDNGEELYRWTWWDESEQRVQTKAAQIRQLAGEELARRAKESKDA